MPKGPQGQLDQQPFFTLKPSPFVMMAVVAMILALVGVGEWRHAPVLVLDALGMSALALAAIAVALHRHANRK